MKKAIFLILIACFTTSFGYGSSIGDWFKGSPKSKSSIHMSRKYEKEMKKFVKSAFRQELTGGQMDTIMRATMEEKIFRQILKDYKKTAKWARKHMTKRNNKERFDFQVRVPKGYESESAVYVAQYKKFITDFVGDPSKPTGRLGWNNKEVSEFLTKDKLQPYINVVMKALEDKTVAKFKMLKP